MLTLKGRTGPILASLLALAAAGCGGNGGHSGSSGKAGLRMTLTWPALEPRMVPNAANSVVAVVKVKGKEVARGLFVRPVEGSEASTTMLLQRLPAGVANVSLTAYPNPDGTGVAQAKGSVTETLVRNEVASEQVSMASTVDTLAIAPGSVSVAPGETAQLGVEARDAAGAVVLLETSHAEDLVWSSAAPATAAVDGEGLLTATSGGTTSVSVELVVNDAGAKKTASVPVTVTASEVTLVSISVTGVSPITMGTPAQFTAIATYSDATTADVTGDVAWSATGGGTFDAAGLFDPSAVGPFAASATLNGVTSNSLPFQVVAAHTLQSITLAPGPNFVMDHFASQQFAVTGHYSDGTTADLTSSATWASSDPGTVSISASGLAESNIMTATSTITATVNGHVATTLVDVSGD